ncbi:tol-pal system-associated acyl-CoA thioesterase [Telmatospirillum sp.]|uniref:tol-pal system-associated acyl-CoA thioesterase n=1 Tax=Telmatospirillum sp. TaxID=2079197 RepID=UPI0028452A30|nr:tol-pal system-associated acyl-CoA thioesterase [Telmatospirillum sp.]MDR3437959.1 tol-pal system-associated acyl-CoA thioesterase [Telmatospirillum sp.]
MNEASSTSGWMAGKTHHFPIRVYYADTDAGGIVYHSTYLDFAERARTEMMRLFGLDHVQLLKDHGLLFAVRSLEVDYRRPARLDDLLCVQSSLSHVGGASLHVNQSIWRDEEELVRLVIRLVCMHKDGRAMRTPVEIRNELQDFLSEKAD